MHTRTHMHTHTHAHAHTHTHTHTQHIHTHTKHIHTHTHNTYAHTHTQHIHTHTQHIYTYHPPTDTQGCMYTRSLAQCGLVYAWHEWTSFRIEGLITCHWQVIHTWYCTPAYELTHWYNACTVNSLQNLGIKSYTKPESKVPTPKHFESVYNLWLVYILS